MENTKMKTATLLLLGCFLALSVAVAEPSKPAAFEIRLVLGDASPDSEQLTCVPPAGAASEQTVAETLHVHKKALLDRSALKYAVVQKNPASGAAEIHITFTDEGSKRFAEVTRGHIGQRLAIVIDGKVYSAPRVMMEISEGVAAISGTFSDQEAVDLVARMNLEATK